MDVTLPIFNEAFKVGKEKTLTYRASALFRPNVQSEDAKLRRAHSRLIDRVRKELNPHGRSWNHRELARYTFNPAIESKNLKLLLDLKTRRAKLKCFVVTFALLDRHVAFLPTLPELWFDLDDPKLLEVRTKQVLETHFRKMMSDTGEANPEDYSTVGEAWISWADFAIRTDPVSEEEKEKEMLALFSSQKMDGASELQAVGHNLDRLYPDGLDRAMFREEEIESLQQHLAHKSQRPILLVGPHQVGKTTLIHELTYRRVDQRDKKNSTKQNIWWLSPQRLISGMSFVGQWEDRLLAILAEAKKRKHILYFDDVLAMFRAGQSRDSNLSVADLLQNAIQDRTVRIVAEMTNEAFHILETKHRGFADLFQVMRIKPTSDETTRQIGIQLVQKLEPKHRVVFDWEALKTATKIQERYASTAVMPGKLVTFLNQLAVSRTNSRVRYEHAIFQFRKRTGLSSNLFNVQNSINLGEIRQKFKRKIIGQKLARKVCENVVSVAGAGLNEPDRPLATLLFLGPTGVGKTQCAKALADIMYSGEKHLLRFDLNQFKSAWSATTLVGTPEQPEGLLTSAVRQQPFSVVLLDEIEKAHPAVFDVLLQVLGEGRLTDALGRTTDFSNCVIVMTSNLGTRRNQSKMGFGNEEAAERFTKAARDFFRPEFFNRIDQIVPFTNLNRDETRKIARGLISEIVTREGLARRMSILQIDESAIDHVVELGYHPELGARAMKRALESQFTRRISRVLAANPIDQPTIIKVGCEDQELRVDTRAIGNDICVRPPIDLTVKETIHRAKTFLQRIRASHFAERPAGELTSDGLTPELLRYFALDEQYNRVAADIEALENSLEESHKSAAPALGTRPRTRRTLSNRVVSLGYQVMKEICATKDIDTYFDEVLKVSSVSPQALLAESVVDQASLLNELALSPPQDECVFAFRDLQGQAAENTSVLSDLFNQVRQFAKSVGFDVEESEHPFEIQDGHVFVKLLGPCVHAIAKRLVGSYLQIESNGSFSIFQIVVVPDSLLHKRTIPEAINHLFSSSDLSKEQTDAIRVHPITQLATESKTTVDFRSGITSSGKVQFDEMMLRGLPLPSEFTEDLE